VRNAHPTRLVDLSVPYPGPTIDTDYFPETKASGLWSASPSANGSSNAWNVNFYYGYDNSGYKGSALFVRLARGGQ